MKKPGKPLAPVTLVNREDLAGSQLERLPDASRVVLVDLAADPEEVMAQISALIDIEQERYKRERQG